MAQQQTPHPWQFFRAGGVDQVLIRSGADVAHLAELDQKLWVALACPTRGIEFDTRTLDLIDTNHDGRIRAPELIAASQWACGLLNDPDDLIGARPTLALSAINTQSEHGAALAAEARRLLELLGRPEATELSLDDVAEREKRLAAMRFNGDGVVPVAAAEQAELQQTLQQIIDTQGGVADRNGTPGVNRAQAEAFFAQVAALHAWHQQAAEDPALAPLGEATLAAVAALSAVEAKVEDFFARCQVAAYDSRAVSVLNPATDDYRGLASQALSLGSAALAEMPLAPVAPRRSLPLVDGVNPAWAQALLALRTQVAAPLLGRPEVAQLSEADWHELKARLAPCRDWLAARPNNPLAPWPAEQIAQLADPGHQAEVLDLVAQDEAVAPQTGLITDLEKLLRLQRDLVLLLNNFVSFANFYRRQGAIFQAGTLYLDGRSCDLSIHVNDAGKHAPLAGMAKAYLAYCDCTRDGQKMGIVSAFTAGDVDFLFVGRNGIFYDRQGRDWDATITKVIENPTSIGQAFLSPYKKFLRMVEEQVAKRAAASDTQAQGKLSTLAGSVATADKAKPAAGTAAAPAAAPPAAGKVDVGTVAAIGVALGSISAVLVGVFAKFVDLGWWIPVAMLGIVLAISGPSMLIAWLKLRQRSLGPILDASGWAINGRMRVNVRLGASLSQTGRIPAHAQRQLRDPFAEQHGPAYTLAGVAVLLALVLVAWRYSLLNPLLPAGLQVQPAAAAASATTTVVVPAPAAPAATVPPVASAPN